MNLVALLEKARTYESHFTRNTAWGASEQLTITANHHHEVLWLLCWCLAKDISGSCVVHVTDMAAEKHKKLLLTVF